MSGISIKNLFIFNNLFSDDDDQDEEDPWHDKTAELSWGGTAAAKHRFK